MAEFEYRGYRIRTIYDKDWQIKIWPPLRPARLIDRVRASRAEGEHTCRHRATAAIDDFIEQATSPGGRVQHEG